MRLCVRATIGGGTQLGVCLASFEPLIAANRGRGARVRLCACSLGREIRKNSRRLCIVRVRVWFAPCAGAEQGLRNLDCSFLLQYLYYFLCTNRETRHVFYLNIVFLQNIKA